MTTLSSSIGWVIGRAPRRQPDSHSIPAFCHVETLDSDLALHHPNLIKINDQLSIHWDELQFRFTHSSGPGGQKVNRTATRVELLFDVGASPSLTDEQRSMISRRLGSYIDGDGTLRLVSQGSASQWRNRVEVVSRLRRMLADSLRIVPRRVPTRPSRAARERRLQAKRRQSARKERRRRPSPDDG